MITRHASRRILGNSARPITSSAPACAVSTKGQHSRRPTRVIRRSTPARPAEPQELTPRKDEPTPPWPTSTSPGTLPWHSYNQNPEPSSSATIVPAESSPPPGSITSIPVKVPQDLDGVLDNATGESAEKSKELFSVQALVVVRQLEMMNIFLGFEEANKYQLLSPEGILLGYLMEEDLGFRTAMMRQALRTHRAFKATVLDTEGKVLLKIHRPFSWINSRIYISTPGETEGEDKIIGEAQQEWHLYRRRYNHFVKRDEEMVQFASTDSGFLAWDFYIHNERGETIGSINRNFAGFGRELFTDTGQYVMRFEGVLDELANPAIESPPAPDALPVPDAKSTSINTTVTVPPSSSGVNNHEETAERKDLTPFSSVPANLPVPSITFDQRAVMLASAVSIDFDYFTRSRGGLGSGMGMWMPFPMGGGSTPAEAGTVAGAEGAGVEDTESGAAEGGEIPAESSNEEYDQGGWDSGAVNRDSGGWNDEVMKDPWASQDQGDVEGGGTWNWGDLFPGDE